MDAMWVYVICQQHDMTALVGPGSLLSEYECPVCVDEYDNANNWRPCCPYMNTTCCGHDDEPWPWSMTITSPGYCDIDHSIEVDVPF